MIYGGSSTAQDNEKRQKVPTWLWSTFMSFVFNDNADKVRKGIEGDSLMITEIDPHQFIIFRQRLI